MHIKIARNKGIFVNAVVFCAFLSFSFLTFSLLSPIVSSNAQDSSASAGSSAYVASISANNSVSLSATPTNTQTVFSGTNTITYTNTCPYGFNVTISSSSSDTNLTRVGTDSGLKTIPTISSGTALGNNTWGYSIDSGSTYNPIPALATPTNIINTSTATTNPATLNVLYGVKINNTIPSGDYSNDVVYTVSVKPQCLTYTLSFDLDNGTGATGVDYSDQVLNYGQTIDLTTYTPTKSGYDFDGWSNGTDTFTGSETNADVNPSNSPAITLTAQWVQNVVGIHSITTMQEMTPTICAETTTPDNDAANLDTDGSHHGDGTYVPSAILTDTRDDSVYHVRKLADGKCWMVDNLKLGKNTSMTLTSEDSDVAIDFVLPAKIETLTSSDFAASNKKEVYIDSDYGGLYSFYAATVGEGSSTKTSGNTEHSICPKGWRLPTGGATGEFNALYTHYNSYARMMYTSNLPGPNYNSPGYAMGGNQVYQRGLVSRFWSSTVYGATQAYRLFINSGDVRPASYIDKTAGHSVRCVAYDTAPATPVGIHSITEMQDMTPSVCAASTTPKASATTFDWDGRHNGDDDYVPRARLKDNRDGKYYLVSKLADGNCWMSQNLELDLTKNVAIVASNNDGTTVSQTPNNTTQTTVGGTSWSTSTFSNWRSYHPQSGESYYQNGITKASTPSQDIHNFDFEKAGNYYNFFAASAGSYINVYSGMISTSSICPKGWRLSGDSSGGVPFSSLINAYSATPASMLADPLNFNRSGRYNDVDVADQGGSTGVGYYWVGRRYTQTGYRLVINSSSVTDIATGTAMGDGYSVRCVAIRE